MLGIVSRARMLLTDWQLYKDSHCGPKTRFSNAINIEVEKDNLANYASHITVSLNSGEWDTEEFERMVHVFGEHLSAFKDLVTIELLRNGK